METLIALIPNALVIVFYTGIVVLDEILKLVAFPGAFKWGFGWDCTDIRVMSVCDWPP